MDIGSDAFPQREAHEARGETRLKRACHSNRENSEKISRRFKARESDLNHFRDRCWETRSFLPPIPLKPRTNSGADSNSHTRLKLNESQKSRPQLQPSLRRNRQHS